MATNESAIDKWRRELFEAGWRAMTATIWRSPRGKLYAGPFGAWKVMRAETGSVIETRDVASERVST